MDVFCLGEVPVLDVLDQLVSDRLLKINRVIFDDLEERVEVQVGQTGSQTCRLSLGRQRLSKNVSFDPVSVVFGQDGL